MRAIFRLMTSQWSPTFYVILTLSDNILGSGVSLFLLF